MGQDYTYCLLYVDGWDCELQEPAGGGRCVGHYNTIDAALHGLDCYRKAAPLMWGPGHLVITGDQGELIHAPTLPAAVFYTPERGAAAQGAAEQGAAAIA